MRAAMCLMMAAILVALSSRSANAQAFVLENPADGAAVSGVGVISGWRCDATHIQVDVDGSIFDAAYGTPRGDTATVCGDTDNGFGLLLNWGLFSDGEHSVSLSDDGVLLTTVTVNVVRFGVSFLRGASGSSFVRDFPSTGRGVFLVWQPGLQSFVVTGRCGGAGEHDCPPATASIAFGWTGGDVSSSHALPIPFHYSSSGGGGSFSRTGVGDSLMTFPLPVVFGTTIGGLSQVTAYRTSAAYCSLDGFGNFAGGEVGMNVRCFDGSGAPVDASYEGIMAFPAIDSGIVAYVHADAESDAFYVPNNPETTSSSGQQPVVSRLGTGSYEVLLPSLGGDGGTAKVTANLTNDGRRCEVQSFQASGPDEIVEVRCVSATGSPVDTKFALTYSCQTGLAPIAGSGWAYLLADQPSSASYTPDATYRASSNGAASTVARHGAGDYTVALPGLATTRGHVQLSSYGDVSRYCTVGAWRAAGTNEEIDVRCFQVGGAPADARFTLSFLQ